MTAALLTLIPHAPLIPHARNTLFSG